MERLTTRSILGGWTLKVPRQEAVDRLAAYEDTGLEPDGIDEALNEAHDLGYQACLNYKGSTWSEAAELQAYRAKIPFDRLDEAATLVKARDEGRVVPDPCGHCLSGTYRGCEGCGYNPATDAEAAIGGGGDGCPDTH